MSQSASRPFAGHGRTLLLCGVLHGFTHLYMVALLPLYLPIQRDFGLASEASATLLLTVMMVAYFAPSYPQGVLADRFSRKILLTVGLGINAAGFIGLAFARSYGAALFWVVIAGLGGSFYHPAATALVAQLFPNSAGRALGLVGIGSSAGFFLAPLYSGWRAAQAGWRAPVLELGLAGLAGTLLFFWLAEDAPSAQPQASSGSLPASSVSPGLWALFLGASFFFSLRDLAGTAMSSLGSLFLQHAHGLGLRQTGLLLSSIFLAATISNPLFGHLSDKGRKRWIATVLLCAAALMALFPHLPRTWMAPALLAYGFFFLASYPISEAALMVAAPNQARGRVVGLFLTVGGLIGNLGHWLAGVWVAGLGDRAQTVSAYFPAYATIAGVALLGLLALPCMAVMGRHKPPSPS
jgi:MFS family permease